MDEFLKDIHTEVFKQWILGQNSEALKISKQTRVYDQIMIETKNGHAEIMFYPDKVIEFRVINKITKEDVFYLHFQMSNMKHALDLYYEMLEVLLQIVDKSSLKILLCCSGGMTTGYFAQEIQQMSEMLHMDYQVDAAGYHELYELGEQYEIILLAPQVSYLLAKTKDILKGKIIRKIPPKIFATYDTRSILEMIEKEKHQLELKKEEKRQELLWIENEIQNKHKKILSLSLFRDVSRVHINYRLYDKRENILFENNIIKSKLKIEDIYDVIDAMLLKAHDIITIGISTPGVIVDGVVTTSGIEDFQNIDLKGLLSTRYSQKIILGNDVNTAVLGAYKKLETYHNLCVLFQPVGSYAGAGIVINDQLITGMSNATGEIQYLPLQLSKPYLVMNKNPEDCIELVAKIITTLVAIVNPEAIVILCKLIPDIEVLKQEIEKYIPSFHIPKLIKADDLTDEILIGQMMLCKDAK